MVRNIVLASVIAVVLIVSQAAPVSALTVDEVQAQIKELLARVAELTRQLNELKQTSEPARPSVIGSDMPMRHRICYLLTRDLREGTEGDDVRGLQEFLYENKFFTVNPTGYFGPMTADAVRRWQVGEGVATVGAFGPMSRERIKIWCGGGGGFGGDALAARPNSGEAPLAVSFFTRLSGFHPNTISYTLDFGDGSSEPAANCYAPADACVTAGTNTHTYTQNGTYAATLNKITDPCPDDGDPNTPRCLAAIHSEVIGKVQINVGPIACTKEYMPVCGAKPIVCITTPCNPIPTTYSNRCTMAADGANLLYAGVCKTDVICPMIAYQKPTCASGEEAVPVEPNNRCPGPWKCVANNQAPTISGFSGPTSLNINQSGTWTINASDPEGGQLTYQIWWGDERVYATWLNASAPESAFVQATTFTHTYANAGTYSVTITVQDSSGKQARTSSSVVVTSAGVACTLEYNPVCGRPPGCANTCTSGTVCPASCQLYEPQTYGNRCVLGAANATLLHEGQCTATSGNWY